jgi:hypothetical protein
MVHSIGQLISVCPKTVQCAQQALIEIETYRHIEALFVTILPVARPIDDHKLLRL